MYSIKYYEEKTQVMDFDYKMFFSISVLRRTYDVQHDKHYTTCVPYNVTSSSLRGFDIRACIEHETPFHQSSRANGPLCMNITAKDSNLLGNYQHLGG